MQDKSAVRCANINIVIGIYDQVIAIPINRGTDRFTRSFLFGVVNVEIKSNRFCGIVPIQADIFLQGYLEFRFRVRERFAGHRLRANAARAEQCHENCD